MIIPFQGTKYFIISMYRGGIERWPLICETFITLNANVKRNVNRQFMVIQAQLEYSCVCNLHIFRCSMKSLL